MIFYTKEQSIEQVLSLNFYVRERGAIMIYYHNYTDLNKETAINDIVLVSQAAYLSYSKARMTFCHTDMVYAEHALSQAICQINEIVYKSIHEYRELKEFNELQELEGELSRALDWLYNVHAAISA